MAPKCANPVAWNKENDKTENILDKMSLLTHYEAVQTAKKILSSSSPSVTESVLW